MQKMNKPVVAQLSKAPIPGNVKTRMQPQLSKEQSLALHRCLTEHSVACLSKTGNWFHHLWIEKHHAFFDALNSRFSTHLSLQPEGDLGARLTYISRSYAGIANLFIGSDCPFIDEVLVTQVFAALASGDDVVMIPATDGGYVGLATVNHYPYLFENIDWGSEFVAEQTIGRAQARGLNVKVFDPLPDIDRPADLSLLMHQRSGLDFIDAR